MMDSLEAIQKSVMWCNKRAILIEEIEHYNRMINKRWYTDEEFGKKVVDDFKFLPNIVNVIGNIVLSVLLMEMVMVVLVGLFNSKNVMILGVPIFLVSVFLVRKVYRKIILRLNKDKILEHAEYREKNLAEKPTYQKILEEKQGELTRLVERMQRDSVCCIPQYYWDDANMLWWYLSNKRAMNLPDAINLLEHEKREWEMLDCQRRQTEASEIAAYNSQIAAENSRIAAENASAAASNSGIAATFSALTYLNTRK